MLHTVCMHFLQGLLVAFLGLFGAHGASALPAPLQQFLPPAPHVRVLFGGDMMFDRSVRAVAKEKGGDFIFSCIDPTLKHADLVVANLEGPITGQKSKSVGSKPAGEFNYTFTFPTSTAPLLAAHGIHIVNLGNNHVLNFGVGGVASTTKFLAEAGVGYFGDPPVYSAASGSFSGVHLTFINYNEFGGDASTTLKQVSAARAAGDLPIVYTHWGVEYATTSSPYMRELAHQFIDAGAEIVIGSHPHVVEEREFYEGKYIYYSLGNFIFDQYWNTDVTHGLLVEVELTQKGVEWVEQIPVELGKDRRTCLSPAPSITQP